MAGKNPTDKPGVFTEQIDQCASLLEDHPDADDFADDVAEIVKMLEALQDKVRQAIAAGW